MCFSVCLAEILGTNRAYAFACIASFARMYFFAHHALDVAVGSLIAYVVTVACHALKTSSYSHLLFAEDYNLWHTIIMGIVFPVVYGNIRKKFGLKKLPRQFVTKAE
jgi:hypothetical protein